MSHLTSARAKLEDPSLGALTSEEMKALLAATEAPSPPKTPAYVGLAHDVVEITQTPHHLDTILKLFKDRNVSTSIIKTWDSGEAYSNIRIGS